MKKRFHLKNVLSSITGNFSVKCKFCNKSVKRKSAVVKNVKRLELVYPKKTFFCGKRCYKNYITYEQSAPRRVSLCNSCPVPADTMKTNTTNN